MTKVGSTFLAFPARKHCYLSIKYLRNNSLADIDEKLQVHFFTVSDMFKLPLLSNDYIKGSFED